MPDLQNFHDVTFPTALSFGATGGPERRNEVVQLTSGREKRNSRFEHSRRRYDAGTGLRSIDDLETLLAFFEARRGSLHGFRFRDPFDRKSSLTGQATSPLDQPIGEGDGVRTTFQLVKVYGAGADAYLRPIRKPVGATVRVAVAGVEAVAGDDFSVDAATGVVSFAPGAVPQPGEAVTAGFEFDVPVRFDTERLSVSLAAFRAGQIPSIPLIEIVM